MKKTKFIKQAVFGLFIGVFFAATYASHTAASEKMTSPVGVWRTVDDNTGETRSLVKIWQYKGKLYGKIVKLIGEKEDNPRCDKCPGKLKNKRVVGLTIMQGLSPEGDEWSGGTILDPESGKRYKVLLELKEGGKKLKVRGYIGVSLLGRTQYWLRIR